MDIVIFWYIFQSHLLIHSLSIKKTDMFEDTFKARLSAHRKGIYQFTVMQNGYDASNKDASQMCHLQGSSLAETSF